MTKWRRSAFLVVIFAAVSVTAANAQIDISASYFESFNSATAGNGTKQTPSNSGGEMVEARYIMNRFAGLGISYSDNRANQSYAPNGSACYFVCADSPTFISARADEIAVNWIGSAKIHNLRPFVLGGGGFYILSPGSSYTDVNVIIRPVIVYGAGLDLGLLPHFGIRVQYRGNLFKAPDTLTLYPATGGYTQASEPMGGLYYRF